MPNQNLHTLNEKTHLFYLNQSSEFEFSFKHTTTLKILEKI